MTWKERIIDALKHLGGEAHRKDIFRYIEATSTTPLPRTWHQTIQDALQQSSSDSSRFDGNEDIFYSVAGIGSGKWGLRNFTFVPKEWIVICNTQKYKIHDAFKQLSTISWRQKIDVCKGDIVYIYVASPESAIMYKCEVSDLAVSTPIDDSAFVVTNDAFTSNDRHMNLTLQTKYDKDVFPKALLLQNGLTQVQSQHKISSQLSRYIERTLMELTTDEAADDHLRDDLGSSASISDRSDFSYVSGALPRESPMLIKGRNVYRRNRQTAINALTHAQHKCEVDNTHKSFIRRKSNGIAYMEPHHLVPMSHSENFAVSLDREQNIVCLCSNCHNEIHYGENFRTLLKTLYDARENDLKNIGIDISFDELVQMYE